jgi:hypothetical protein
MKTLSKLGALTVMCYKDVLLFQFLNRSKQNFWESLTNCNLELLFGNSARHETKKIMKEYKVWSLEFPL